MTFTHHFDPRSDGTFRATEYDADATGIAGAAASGNQLIWRWSITAGNASGVAVPNGDGTTSGGRFPSITFPH